MSMVPYLTIYQALCDKYGVRHTYIRANEDIPTWDGQTLNLADCDGVAWVLHEVAHMWTAEFPHLPNYGLGTDPGGGGNTYAERHDIEFLNEENMALVVGLWLLTQEEPAAVTSHVEWYGIGTLSDDALRAACVIARGRCPKKLSDLDPDQIVSIVRAV